MHAIVRLNSNNPDKLATAGDRLKQFDKLHAAQPGYVGTVVVDLHEGHRLVLNLWESQEHSETALSILGPEVGRVLNPLMSKPSELIGAGTVLSTDLTPGGA